MKYTFGTSNDAASRLEEIARFFNRVAADWIQRTLSSQPETAVDLGCGPGFTTQMLSTSTHAARTYGFDNSDHFLNMAQARFPDLQFIKHDITECPFPVNGDVAYSRFVLSHLIEPVATINKWISQVRRNGTLFIDELEDIDTDSDLFTIYLSTNARLVASQGASLFVGKSLSSGIYNGEVLSNESVVLPVQNWQAATWFLPNTLTIWRASSVVSETPSDSEIQRVSNDLKRAIDTDRTKSNITWKMRHIAIRAT